MESLMNRSIKQRTRSPDSFSRHHLREQTQPNKPKHGSCSMKPIFMSPDVCLIPRRKMNGWPTKCAVTRVHSDRMIRLPSFSIHSTTEEMPSLFTPTHWEPSRILRSRMKATQIAIGILCGTCKLDVLMVVGRSRWKFHLNRCGTDRDRTKSGEFNSAAQYDERTSGLT